MNRSTMNLTQATSTAAVRCRDIAWVMAFAACASVIQLATKVPIDADTEYHVAVARLIRAHGVLHAFPWTPFSWLADHYADKELLFHLLMVPFSALSWIQCAQIVGSVAGTAMLVVAYTVLRAEQVRWAGVWVLSTLASSSFFLVRFALVRPHVLSMTLALAVTWAAARRRWLPLMVSSFLYPFSYVAWHLPLLLIAVVEIARALSGSRLDPHPWLIAAGSIALGLLVHPNFPEIVQFTWIVIKDVLVGTAWTGRAGFAQGTEFLPADPAGMFRFGLFPVAFALTALYLAARRREVLPLSFAFTALAFGIMTLRSWRFMEYFAPFATVALAVSVKPRRSWIPAALLAACAVFAVTVGREPLGFFGGRPEGISPAEAHILQRNVPEGTQVFTCGWGLTGQLMLALPERRFLVALDPVLMFKKDPGAYATWFALVHDAGKASAAIVRDTFSARFILCEVGPEYRPFLVAMSRDPLARLTWHSRSWALFEIAPSAGAGPTPEPSSHQ